MGILMLNGNNYTGGVQKVYGSSSGAIATFADGGDNKPLQSLKVAITPQQASGTPSPSNPLPISGWTGANIYKTGINVWDEEWVSGALTNDGTIDETHTTRRTTTYIPIAPNINLYHASPSSALAGRVAYYDRKKNLVEYSSLGIRTNEFTTPNNAYYMRITFGSGYGGTYNNDISINYPSTDTDYHAYNGTTYPITWSDAGTVYGGYIDYERKKVVVTWNSVDLGSLSWSKSSSTQGGFYATLSEYKKGNDTLFKCEQYEFLGYCNGSSSHPYYPQNGGFTYYYRSDSAVKEVYIYDTTYSDMSETEFKSAVSGIKLVYELATTIEYDLDEPLPTINTLLGNNNIWSDTGDIEECVYQRDLNLAFNELWDLVHSNSGTRSLSALNLTKSVSTELKEETTEETKEEEQNEDKR